MLALFVYSAITLSQAQFYITVLALFRSALFGPLFLGGTARLYILSGKDTLWFVCQHVGTFSETANCQHRTQLLLYLNVPALFAVRGLAVDFEAWVYLRSIPMDLR